MFTASYRLTGPLLRRSYFRELWRTQGGWLLSVPLALGVAIWSSFDPDYRWFGGFLAGASLSYIGLLYSSYRGAQRYRLDRVVNTTITDGGLHFDFASAASDIPWSSISSVRQTPDGLVLTTRLGAQPVLLPSDALSSEASTFVMHKVKEAGGRARDGA